MAFTPVKPGSSLYPDVRLRWAPTTQPTAATQTYVDITDRLRGFGWQYGRNDELAEFQPGNGYVILDNRDRAFDPSFTAGTWYGNIKPRRMFEMQYRYNSGTYDGFVAYARGFPQEWPGQGKDSLVRVDLVDNLGVLEGVDLVAGAFTRDAEDTGTRIGAVLDAVNVPAGRRNIDTGIATVAEIAVTDVGTSGLAHAKTVAKDENGALFTARDGKLTFHNRHRRLNQASTAATFTDSPSAGIRYEPTLGVQWDDTYLLTCAYVQGPSGDPGTANAGTTAAGDYLELCKSWSSQLATVPEREAAAQYQVFRYQQPTLRTPAVTVQPATSPAAAWPAILGLEISDRVVVQRFASGTAMTLVQNVESIGHQVVPGGPWITQVGTSPADTNNYWTIEDSTFGSIDSTYLIAP